MRGTAPLLGVLSGLAIPPNSRVPHLAAHILSRRSRNLLKPDYRHQFQHDRSLKTSSGLLLEALFSRNVPIAAVANVFDESAETLQTTIEERNHRIEAEGQEQDDTDSTANAGQQNLHTQHGSQPTTAALARMQALVGRGHPETVRFGLRDFDLTREFIRDVDDSMFTKAVQLLDAERFFEEYKLVYRYVKPSLIAQPIFRSVRPLEQRLEAFGRDLDRIFALRRAAGHKLNLDACKVILKAGQVMGDAKRALQVFNTIMPEDGIQPDLECYNYLMEALCWNRAYTKSEWQNLRVTDSRLRARRARRKTPPLRFSGHKVDYQPSQERETKMGLRVQVLTKFRELVAKELHGDEATFTNVMVAMGREGDLAGVKSVLKSVWNVDVDMLGAYDEEEIESPTFYEEGTPLRPSSRLLFTVVHVFGTNNQVGLAFVLLDYISRNYNLSIPPDIWFELCNWTRVMSDYRTQAQKRKGEAVGQVDWRIFERLWQVMTDEPHNIVPDVPFTSLRAANFRRARMLDQAVDSIRLMKVCLLQKRAEAFKLFWEMKDLLEGLPDQDLDQPLTVEFLDKRHDFIIASQKYDRDLQLVVVAIRTLLTDQSWSGSGEQYEWAARRLPTLLGEFADGAPDKVDYHTPTGFVQIDFVKHRRYRWIEAQMIKGSHFNETTWLGIMRKMLDIDDHEVVRQRAETMLPGGSLLSALNGNTHDDLEQAVLAMLGSSAERRRIVEILGMRYSRDPGRDAIPSVYFGGTKSLFEIDLVREESLR